MSTVRHALVRRLGPLVALVAQLPRWVPFAAVAGLLVGGLLAQGVAGAALLLVLTAVLAALLLLSWPVLQPGARAVRLAVVAVVAVRAVSFLL